MNQRLSHFFPPSTYEFQKQIEILKAKSHEQTVYYDQLYTKIEMLFSVLQGQLSVLIQTQTENHARIGSEFQNQFQVQEQVYTRAHLRFQNQLQEIQSAMTRILELCCDIQEKSLSIIEGVSGLYQKDYPVDVQFEREYYKDFPVCTSSKTPEFQEKFLSLICGLDEESIETITLALQRLRLIKTSMEPLLDLYSIEEKGIMQHLTEHFWSNIIELSKSCYFYRGYLLPVNHVEVCVFVDRCGLPYLEHPEKLANCDIIDAGAFIGDSALILSPLTKGKVYAFEPTPENYTQMLQTIEMNHLINVEPCPCALGAKNGGVMISVNNSVSTQFENAAFRYEHTIKAKVVTVDDFVREHNLQVGLIKADIEGAESLLLQGAIETLKSQKPALLISIYHNAHDFFEIKPWLEKLNLGYKFKIRHSVGGTVMTETLLIAEI